jgi:hypothetical protein
MRFPATRPLALAILATSLLGTSGKADANPTTPAAPSTAKEDDAVLPPVLRYFSFVTKGRNIVSPEMILEKSADGTFLAFKDTNADAARDRDNIIELKVWTTATSAVLAMHEYRSYGSTPNATFWRFKGEQNETLGGIQLADMLVNAEAWDAWENERMQRTRLECCSLFALLPKTGQTMTVLQIPGDMSGSIKKRPTGLKSGGEL